MHVKEPLKVPSKGALLHVPSTGSLWREMLRHRSQWFIHLFTFVGVPKKGVLPRNAGKTYSHLPGSPERTQGPHTMECGLLTQEMICYTAITTRVMQLSPRYLPPWLGQTRAPLACVCRSNPIQGIPSTAVTASHVTRGRVEQEST